MQRFYVKMMQVENASSKTGIVGQIPQSITNESTMTFGNETPKPGIIAETVFS